MSYGTLSVVLDHNRPPIWHALAALPTLTTPQWQALVTDVAGGLDDRTLLRVLFERPDRSDEQQQWLIDQEYIASSLSEVMASPAATVEHVRGILTGKDRAAPAVADALSQRVDLIDRPELVALAVEAIEQLDRYEAALTVAMRWPAGRPVPREVLDALAGRAVDVPPERSRRIWSKPPTRPVSDHWTRLLPVLCSVEPAVLAAVAARYQLVQAVLLEYGEDLDPVIVAACLPVWSDRDLGGPQDLPAVARLQTLRRWAKRYPELADQARSAWTSAGRDAARALRDGEQWELVDELVQFTTDPQILADAVESVAGFVQELIVDCDRGIERTLEVDQAVKAAGTALVTLATCPHTPDEALRAVLPLAASPVTVDEIAAARPSLAQDCAAERLSRTGMFLRQPQLVEDLVDVPDDRALAATGDPAAALMSYLPYLQDADRQQRARLATRLLQSRHVTSDVLLALPGEVVSASPWHAAMAAAMVTEVCRDDPQRWSVLHLQLPGRDPLTFGGVLAELRDYEPLRTVTYGAQAGYRYCHACHLVTPHQWPPVPQQEPRGDMKIIRWTCRLCMHWALPSAVLPADTSLPCDRCEKGIQHPASAAVLACPACDQMFFHPDLPDELRPRVDAVVAEQHRIGDTIRQLSERLEQLPAPWRQQAGPEPAPTPAVPSQRQPIRPATMPALPADWLNDTEPAAAPFRTALKEAIRRSDSRTQARAAALRYGLGRARRALPDAQVADRLGVSTAAAKRAIKTCLTAIADTATKPLPASPTVFQRTSLIAAHLAANVVGELPADDVDALSDALSAAAQRLRTFLDVALPQVDPASATRLILLLTGHQWDLRHHELNHLIREVRARRDPPIAL